MSTGPEELSLETIAPEDADLIDLRYEGVDLPLDENADPTQVELACGEHLGVVSLEGGYDDESFVDLHVLGEVFRGESAYATAVRNGFVGTEAQWLETLVGPESPNAAVALAAQLAAEQAADRAEAAETGASISETASADHAAAASTARGQAEAYSDSASAYAQASLDFQTQAETSAGEALAYRNQAAQSSTDADSAAARAETAEGVSVTMRNQAQGFSEASAASSQSAETYMDESRVEAQAARDAHLLAETSRENSLAHSQASYDSAQEALARSTEAGEYASAALTSRLAAEAARDDTDVAAAAVIIDRDIVIARADEAGEYAEAAESHRASALTSAGAASVSAENSAISETNAESSRVAAEAARDIAVASSGDAADALTATISYRDQAEIFSDSAGDSATAAATARVAAESARDTANGAASAAATSASSASSSQTAAASSASAASTSATNAATSAGAASTSATNASNSATTASGHAATASTQATNAANSATAAGGSATAASGSASSAATSATNAGNSATSANSSSVSAASSYTATRDVVTQLIPSTFEQNGLFWRYDWTGAPNNGAGPVINYASNYFDTVAGEGRVYHMATAGGGSVDVSPEGVYRLLPNRRIRITARFCQIDGTLSSPILYNTQLGSDYGAAPGGLWSGLTVASPSYTWQNLVNEFDSNYAIGGGAVYLRPLLRHQSPAGGRYWVKSILIEDVTESVAAAVSASAAATSASSASTSATNAGTSATAAATSATNASTSAGSAGTSATNAANSATTATTQANNASTSASTAATHATNAGNSASAAGTSATTAGTHATNAGNSATAANASQVAAASSYNAALTTAAAILPSTFNPDTRHFTNQVDAYSPTAWNAGGGTSLVDVTGEGRVVQFSNGEAQWVGQIGTFPIRRGDVYELSARSRTVTNGTDPSGFQPHIMIQCYTSAGDTLGNVWLDSARQAAAAGWETRTFSTSANNILDGFWSTAAYGRAFHLGGYNAGGTAGVAQLSMLRLREVSARDAAANSATAAATSASSASTSATNAGTSATAASTSATNANTSAGNAGTSATNAANSATTATTQANNASTSASTAATHATNAGNSATAAGTSATTAGTHATNAGNSATAASASAVSAASSFASAVSVTGNTQFTHGLTGISAGASANWTAANYDGRSGGVIYVNGGASAEVYTEKIFPIDTSRKYRVRGEVYASGGGGTLGIYVGLRCFNATGSVLLSDPGSYLYAASVSVPAGTGWQIVDSMAGGSPASGPITGEGTGTWKIFPPGTKGAQLLCLMYDGSTTGVKAVNWLELEDITESQAALSSATAASTSASSASTSAGAAGVSATSAATQATNAGVSAGNAASSASTAATQASNASASAASASSSATVAANLYGATANLLQKSQFFAEDYPGTPAPWTGGVHNGAANVASVWFDGSWSPPGERSLAAYDTVPVHTADGYYDFYSEAVPWEGAKRGCASVYSGIHRTGGRLIVAMLDGGFNVLAFADPNDAAARNLEEAAGGVRLQDFKRLSVFFTPPSTCVYIRLLLRKYSTNAGQSSSYAFWARPMVSEATATQTTPPPWAPANLSAQQSALAASVSTVQDAVVDLETQNALARFEVSAATGGGTARMRLVSTTYGTNILLDADKIFFGDNTVFDNAVDVLVTTTGSNSRILAWGAAFGTDGQLTEWEGPSSVTWGNHSRANAYFYRANVAPYVGGSALASGFTVTSSHTSRVGTRVGAGSVTSGTVTLTPAGASGSVTYSWSRVYGDSSITATSGSSAATAFTTTVTAGQEKQALFAWTATDGAGKVQTGTVGVGLIGNV